MENKTVAFCTLGCKVNQYETNAMIQEFMKNGYTIVEFDEKADVYIVNTCTVTNMADRKSRQMLKKSKGVKPRSHTCCSRLLCPSGKGRIRKNSRNRFNTWNKRKEKYICIGR